MFNILTPKQVTDRPRLTVLQAARYLKVSRQYIYKLIKQQKLIPHDYLGRKCLYIDECLLPRKTVSDKPLKSGYLRRRRTQEELKKAKLREQKRLQNKRARHKKFLALPKEEQERRLRRKRNLDRKKLYRREKARKKKGSTAKWNSGDGQQE